MKKLSTGNNQLDKAIQDYMPGIFEELLSDTTNSIFPNESGKEKENKYISSDGQAIYAYISISVPPEPTQKSTTSQENSSGHPEIIMPEIGKVESTTSVNKDGETVNKDEKSINESGKVCRYIIGNVPSKSLKEKPQENLPPPKQTSSDWVLLNSNGSDDQDDVIKTEANLTIYYDKGGPNNGKLRVQCDKTIGEGKELLIEDIMKDEKIRRAVVTRLFALLEVMRNCWPRSMNISKLYFALGKENGWLFKGDEHRSEFAKKHKEWMLKNKIAELELKIEDLELKKIELHKDLVKKEEPFYELGKKYKLFLNGDSVNTSNNVFDIDKYNKSYAEVHVLDNQCDNLGKQIKELCEELLELRKKLKNNSQDLNAITIKRQPNSPEIKSKVERTLHGLPNESLRKCFEAMIQADIQNSTPEKLVFNHTCCNASKAHGVEGKAKVYAIKSDIDTYCLTNYKEEPQKSKKMEKPSFFKINYFAKTAPKTENADLFIELRYSIKTDKVTVYFGKNIDGGISEMSIDDMKEYASNELAKSFIKALYNMITVMRDAFPTLNELADLRSKFNNYYTALFKNKEKFVAPVNDVNKPIIAEPKQPEPPPVNDTTNNTTNIPPPPQ
jgi:hypothetical protein